MYQLFSSIRPQQHVVSVCSQSFWTPSVCMCVCNLRILFDTMHARTHTNIYFYTRSIVDDDSSKHRYKLMRHIQTTSLATTIIRLQVYVRNRTLVTTLSFSAIGRFRRWTRTIRWVCSHFACPLCRFPTHPGYLHERWKRVGFRLVFLCNNRQMLI